MSDPAIRTAAGEDELRAAAELIALSFDHLDANHYLVPDPQRRVAVMTEFFAVLSEHAASGAGEVLLADDGAATAVWFDRTAEVTEPVGYAERIAAAAGPYADRFAELDKAFETSHPADAHWHIAFLAVRPGRQNEGLGGALLDHAHRRLDRDGVPAYLEATNADNIRLYERHGYQIMEPAEIAIGTPRGADAGGGTGGATFWRMWRTPRTA